MLADLKSMQSFHENVVIRQGFCHAEFLGVRQMSNIKHGPGEAYRIADIATASPSRLSEILYDGIIELCTQAIKMLDDGMTDQAADKIEKALSILARIYPLIDKTSQNKRVYILKVINRINNQLNEALEYHRRRTLCETISLLQTNKEIWQEFTINLKSENKKESWIA